MNDQNIAAIYALRVPLGSEKKAKHLTHALANQYGLTIHNHINLSAVSTPHDNKAKKFNQGLITLLSNSKPPDSVCHPARNTTFLSMHDGLCQVDPFICKRLSLKDDAPVTLLSELRNAAHAPYTPPNFAHLMRDRVHDKLTGHWVSIMALASSHPALILSSRGRQFKATVYIHEDIALLMFANFSLDLTQDDYVKTMAMPLQHHEEDNSLFLMLHTRFLFTKVNSWCNTVAKSPYELCYTAERYINRNIL